MAAHRISDLLARSGQLKTMSREAQRLTELELLIFEAAPGALSEATRVKQLRAGTLVLLADNAAVAVKLRQLLPRLLVCVRKRDPEVSGIRVEVQPARGRQRAAEGSRKKLLTAGAIKSFENLAGRLRDSPLKTAVRRLVQHQKKGRGQQ